MQLNGILLSTRKLLLVFLLLIVGLSLMIGGLMTLYFDNQRFESRISDAEVIERAKKLGMIDLKEYLEQNEPPTATTNP